MCGEPVWTEQPAWAVSGLENPEPVLKLCSSDGTVCTNSVQIDGYEFLSYNTTPPYFESAVLDPEYQEEYLILTYANWELECVYLETESGEVIYKLCDQGSFEQGIPDLKLEAGDTVKLCRPDGTCSPSIEVTPIVTVTDWEKLDCDLNGWGQDGDARETDETVIEGFETGDNSYLISVKTIRNGAVKIILDPSAQDLSYAVNGEVFGNWILSDFRGHVLGLNLNNSDVVLVYWAWPDGFPNNNVYTVLPRDEVLEVGMFP